MTYNDKVVRQFVIATILWGIVGMLVGVIIAAQLWLPILNLDIPWLTYGRLRPLHTNAVIFAFGGSGLIGTSLYVVQRTCHVRLISDKLASLVFWGWQACHRGGGRNASTGLDPGQGIRRARMADRYSDHPGVGRVRGALFRDDRQTPGQPHLRGQLVLWRIHPDHRGAAYRQQPVVSDRNWQVLPDLHGYGRCDGAMVVRSQRRRASS